MENIEINKDEQELRVLLDTLEKRNKSYAIMDTTMDRIPQQKKLLEDFIERLKLTYDERKRFYLYYGGNGSGKCWSPKEPMLMYDGTFKPAGELRIGDKLMGVDSTAREVTSTYWGDTKMYKITPESGEPIVVNKNHQLMLIHRRRNRKGVRCKLQDVYSHLSEYTPEGKLVQISVDDYMKKSTKWKAEAYMWRPSILNYDTKQLSIDPYFLGIWLGDGSSDSMSITSVDKEVIDYTYDYANKLGLAVTKDGDITYNVVKKYKSRYGLSGVGMLRELGVLNNKHIPLDYLTSNEEQRLELLAGLIDTDGSFDSRGTPRYEITQKSETLARNIMQLARSLGFRSSITSTIKVCTNSTRYDYTPGTYYRVTINGDVWRIPVKVNRKKLQNKKRRNNKDWRVSKFIVEDIGNGQYVGFTLDGDKLHLDKNFIVHHNTAVGAYITVLLALGHDTAKYGLPFIGSKKNIWIGTKSGSNVKSVIHQYLLGDYSITRIPPEMVARVTQDNGILKAIELTNGCKIHIKTYDQGSENLQGGNPDFIWLDEEPVNEGVWDELVARVRDKKCEMLITMTPLSGLTKVYSFFFEQNSEQLRGRSKIYKVSSVDNPFTDKTWTLGMNDETYRLRVEGSFESPTGLVYSSFMRSRNVVPHFHPSVLQRHGQVKYYRGIDFGTSHPTACVWIAQDEDDNFYVYDELLESNMLLSDIVARMNVKTAGTNIEYTIRDSAAKREGLELQRLGIRTIPADKYSKGANDLSNRRAGILMMNDLFHKGKLLISDRCTKLIKELETHYYKEGGKKDGEVVKENDDLLDALRYIVYMIKKNSSSNKKHGGIKEINGNIGLK